MSRLRDQLAKQYLEDFLEHLGMVQRNLEVPGLSTGQKFAKGLQKRVS